MDPSLLVGPLLPVFVVVFKYLCWSMGTVAVLGPFALLKTIRLPARLGVQAVKDEELSDAQRAWFEELDGLLGSQGFRPALTFVAKDLPANNLSRAYLSTGDPSIALASAVSQKKGSVQLAKSYVEFAVDFQDGGSLLTTTVLEQGGIASLPQSKIFRHPQARHPLVLKQHHDAHLRPLLAQGARFHRADELGEVIEADHARKMAHNVAIKRWRQLPDGRYRLTFRNALRVVAQFLNPFSEQPVDLRVAVALTLVLVPALGTAVLGVPQLGWLPVVFSLAPPSLDPGTTWLLAFAPVVLLGSLALGVVLEARAVPWVFFFHLAESGALAPAGRSLTQNLGALALIFAGTKAAGWVSNLVNSRRQRV
jgi:hypothetical protein